MSAPRQRHRPQGRDASPRHSLDVWVDVAGENRRGVHQILRVRPDDLGERVCQPFDGGRVPRDERIEQMRGE